MGLIMKYLISIFFSLTYFNFSYAADWEFVKKTSYGDVYFDKASVGKNRDQEYYVGILTDFGVRQKGIDRLINGSLVYDTHFQPLSSKSAYLIHCSSPKSALLGSMYFSDGMSKGKKIFSEVEPDPIWTNDRDTDIDNIHSLIRQKVCK